jgi:hypothetical protein
MGTPCCTVWLVRVELDSFLSGVCERKRSWGATDGGGALEPAKNPYERPVATAPEMSPELSAQLQVENQLPAFREQGSPQTNPAEVDEDAIMTRPPAPGAQMEA